LKRNKLYLENIKKDIKAMSIDYEVATVVLSDNVNANLLIEDIDGYLKKIDNLQEKMEKPVISSSFSMVVFTIKSEEISRS
jgi:hypothetical protein